jgi:hypothetical protein
MSSSSFLTSAPAPCCDANGITPSALKTGRLLLLLAGDKARACGDSAFVLATHCKVADSAAFAGAANVGAEVKLCGV